MNNPIAIVGGMRVGLCLLGRLLRRAAPAVAMIVVGGGLARGGDPSPRGGIMRALQKPITVEFDRNNLEVTLDIISEETDIPIEILKTDLQLAGITNCQSHGLEARNMPAGQVLRICLKKANRDGKLIYVIRREAEDQPEKLFITTEVAATKRGDKIPAEFIRVAQRLTQPIDYRSDGETAALGILSVCAAIGIDYEILRGDLAAAEITDRALPEFEMKQRPAGEVLRKIIAAQDPSGRLIYVIKAPTPGEREKLYITTRDAAAKRDDRVPAEFTAKPSSDRIGRALHRQVTVKFDFKGFEAAMAIVAEKIGVPIEINNKDMMLVGMTKSNSISLDLRNFPAGHLLQICLAKTNNQNLVYVVRRGDTDKDDKIVITTAAGAASRGETPEPFMMSAAQALELPIRLDTKNNSLELILGILAANIGVPCWVLREDVKSEPGKSEGYTIPSGSEKPAREHLRELLLRFDPSNELTYVVKSQKPSGRETIFITTRTAARRRGDVLPDEVFKPGTDPKSETKP